MLKKRQSTSNIYYTNKISPTDITKKTNGNSL